MYILCTGKDLPNMSMPVFFSLIVVAANGTHAGTLFTIYLPFLGLFKILVSFSLTFLFKSQCVSLSQSF